MCSIPHSQWHHRQSSDEISREEDPYYSGLNTWPAKGYHAHHGHAHQRPGKPCLMQHYPPPLPPPPPPLHAHDPPSYFLCSRDDLNHDHDIDDCDSPATPSAHAPHNWREGDACCRGRF